MIQVIKRDGNLTPFEVNKISEAMKKAFQSLHMHVNDDIVNLLVLRVTADFQSKIVGNKISVEDIQDSVERVLSISGYSDVAKAYILYRKQRENVRQITASALDYTNLVDSYLNAGDFQERETSLQTYSLGGLILSNSATITTNYWLNTVYDEEISAAHQSGLIHIHDLNMLTADSAGWSLYSFIKKGVPSVNGKVSSKPAKHLNVLCNQIVNILGILQNEWSGAQSICSFDVYLAPFIKVDALSYHDVKKCLESFVFGLNMPSRWGTQPPFSNISLDWNVPDDMKHKKAIVGGRKLDFTYGDCQKEMILLQEALFDVLYEGDHDGRGFQFPITTVIIDDSFSFDESNRLEKACKLCAKYGSLYFVNSKGENADLAKFRMDWSSLNPSEVYYKKCGGYFLYGENTGSIGTVTLNLPRISYMSKSKEHFFASLSETLDLAARVLYVKRQVISKFFEAGLYPYTKQFIDSFHSHVSAIGIIGLEEACQQAVWFKKDFLSKEGKDFGCEILKYIEQKIKGYSLMYNSYYVLEQTPAESVSYRFPKIDSQLYPDMRCTKKMYYNCGSQISLSKTDDLFMLADYEQVFEKFYNGCHSFFIYQDKGLSQWQSLRLLLEKMISLFHIDTFSISVNYSICHTHGYFRGALKECPYCHGSVEVWSQIAGYYQMLQLANKGNRMEFMNRMYYFLD